MSEESSPQEETSKPKRKRKRDYKKVYAQRLAHEARTKKAVKKKAVKKAAKHGSDSEEPVKEKLTEEEIEIQVGVLRRQTADSPPDNDRDMMFAYQHMADGTVEPLDAPSLGAWSWYQYSRRLPTKFLDTFAKREDAKIKQAGTVTAQRLEDDKRHQFGVLDRIEAQLKLNIKTVIRDLMTKFPEDTLLECRTYQDEWNAFFQKYPHS